MPSLKYIDLFAGCGGLSTGLHLAGWKGVFAVEKNVSAFETLKANLIVNKKHFDWPEWLTTTNWDIKTLLAEKGNELKTLQGSIDLVVGGPPCQGFSTAGRRRESDERNNLVHSYLSFVELVKPKAILFENVRGFTMKFKASPKEEVGEAYSCMVIRQLQKLGFTDARGELVDMSDYGIPQRRQRYIVVGTLNNQAEAIFNELSQSCASFLSSRGIPRKNTVRSALSDLRMSHGVEDSPDTIGFAAGKASAPSSGLQKHLRISNRSYLPDSHRFVNHTRHTESVFRRLLSFAPRNRCVAGESRELYGLKKRSITVLQANQPSPTITTIPDDFLHYEEPRVMTVRECARLQTFPDWFEFKGPYTTGGKNRVHQAPRYTQVGNAVPPLFAEMIGIAIKKIISHA
jgi:DNA (cytosine-5)-methyltransferase 1